MVAMAGMTSIVDQVVGAVKRKRELAALDDAFVKEKIQKILTKEQRIHQKLTKSKSFKEFSRSAEFKALKSLVREELRKVYGVFQKEKKGKKGNASPKEKLLSHQSSAERYAYYEEIYKKLFSITGKPTTLLDLGCGANPYSYAMLGCMPYYVAVDLPSSDLQEIADFFRKRKIEGEVLGVDLVNNYAKVGLLLESNHFDVAFLFKLLDSLETVKRNISRSLLDSINATWLVVSFPTVSIGGKKHIKKERRTWFEKLLKRKGWHWQELEVGEEVFYVVLKDPDRLAEERYNKRTGRHETSYKQYSFEDELKKIQKLLPEGKILDLGCGIGRDSLMFSKAGYAVVGIDRAKKLLYVAKKKAPKASFVEGDIRELPFEDEEFDLVWSLASLVHFYDEDALKVLKECQRVLKKDGILFVSVKEGEPELAEREGKKLFFRKYEKEELVALIEKSGFSVFDVSKHQRLKNKAGYGGDFYRVYAKKK